LFKIKQKTLQNACIIYQILRFVFTVGFPFLEAVLPSTGHHTSHSIEQNWQCWFPEINKGGIPELSKFPWNEVFSHDDLVYWFCRFTSISKEHMWTFI